MGMNDYDGWLEFLLGDVEQPRYVKKAQRRFEVRVAQLLNAAWRDDSDYQQSQSALFSVWGYGGIARAVAKGDPDAVKIVRRMTERQLALLDKAIDSGTVPLSTFPFHKYDWPNELQVAYYSFALFGGYGVGFWDGDEPWHRAFAKIVKRDKKLNEIFQYIDMNREYDSDDYE